MKLHPAISAKLAGLQPLAVRTSLPPQEVAAIFGEAEMLRMLEQRGYRIDYAA